MIFVPLILLGAYKASIGLSIMATVSQSNPVPSQAKRVAVFVHGAGGGGWEWNAWVPVFQSKGWECVQQDLVPNGAGISKTTFGDYVHQVHVWAKRHPSTHLVLVGASMGGILALKACEELHPSAVVLVNSVGPLGVGKRKSKSYPDVIEWSKGTLKETRDSMPDSDEASIQFAFKHWRDESGSVLRTISSGVAVSSPICPVLVILGDKDGDVPNAVGRQMAKLYHGDLKVYSGMSHVGPLLGTKAANVALDTTDWLDKHVR